MRVSYDDQVDALYIELGAGTPEGVIEVAEGIHVDTTADNLILGIEILDASKKVDLKTIFSYSLDIEKDLPETSVGPL